MFPVDVNPVNVLLKFDFQDPKAYLRLKLISNGKYWKYNNSIKTLKIFFRPVNNPPFVEARNPNL